MSANDHQPVTTVTERPRTSSATSTVPTLSSLKTPRAARFAEATSIHSPVEPAVTGQFSFNNPPTNHYTPQPQPADFGLGYFNEKHVSVEMEEIDSNSLRQAQTQGFSAPLVSPPLKSAMKTPGAPPKSSRSAFFNEQTEFRDEEENLKKQEALTEKEQAKDLRVKVRVRIAKMILRSVNFACSLIVLSMLAATFVIFNATKALPPRNNLPPWAEGTNPWAQIVLLVIACISLIFAIVILGSYFRGGHNRAEKVAVYYTVFSVAFFVFSIIMWAIGAGILNGAKQNGHSKDLWGWACKDNTRRKLFENEVSYQLVCRLNNWSLVCCIIEVVIEVIFIAIYGIIFFRFYSKRQLRKSMAKRDTARSDLYLAQLRSQSAPNTPGLNGPYSARDGGWKAPIDRYDASSDLEAGTSTSGSVQYVDASRPSTQPKPFVLQPPPIRIQGATPKMQQGGFSPVDRSASYNSVPQSPPLPTEQRQEHFAAAPGEQVYEAVPIPGAYSAPINSPTTAPRQMSFPESHGR